MGFGLNHNSLFLMVELNFCASAPLVPNIGGCFDGDGGFREGWEATHHSFEGSKQEKKRQNLDF